MEENREVKPARRRRHSEAFKAEAVKACMQQGVSIAAVALHYRKRDSSLSITHNFGSGGRVYAHCVDLEARQSR